MQRATSFQTATAALAIALFLSTAASPARAALIDDFNDGNDDGWTHVDLLSITGIGMSDYDASSGEYVISSVGEVPVLPEACNGGGSFYTASLTDPQFAQGVVRAKVSFDNDISNVLVGIRADTTGNGYNFAANNAVDRIFVDRLTNFVGLENGLDSMDFVLTPGEDYIIEGTAVGPNLSMKIWKVGDPEPTEPQLTAVDSTYTEGGLWVATYYCATPPLGGHISARFDDVSFTVPEPATWLFTVLGYACLPVTRRWRTH